MKGRLNTSSSGASCSPLTSDTSMDMPVTPPSIKRLESKKPCPNAAEKIPRVISTKLFGLDERVFHIDLQLFYHVRQPPCLPGNAYFAVGVIGGDKSVAGGLS